MNVDLRSRAAAIRLAIFDVDGVMTDGRLYIGPDGMELKAVSVRDGHGIKCLRAAGIEPAVISGRPSAAIEHRLDELGVHHAYLAVRDKLSVYHDLLARLGLPPEQSAFMGDDEPDLQVMEQAGLAMTVSDAEPRILEIAHWISTRPGGMGAVREACDFLIEARSSA